MRNERSVLAGAFQLDALISEKEKQHKALDRQVILHCAATICPKPLVWLWPGWVAAGKLTVLAGNAGTGKTTLALAIAAALTSGGGWPDGTAVSSPGNVLIWSGEDAPDDTLVPRLIASGADLDRCHFIAGTRDGDHSVPFDPSQDMYELNKAVVEIGGVSLLIVDPIVSAVAGDMHRANDVRRSLQAFVDFATTHGCGVIGITHFAKGGAGKLPADRVIGSQAFGALARMVLVAAKEEGGERRVLARAKSNIANDDGGIAYSVESATILDSIETTRIAWNGPVEGTARQILGDVEQLDGDDDVSEKVHAERFLRDLLSDGPVPAKRVKADADGAGYSLMTIRRAQKSLKVIAFREGYGGKGSWFWKLPD
jgi:putative DNA primase/helicase